MRTVLVIRPRDEEPRCLFPLYAPFRSVRVIREVLFSDRPSFPSYSEGCFLLFPFALSLGFNFPRSCRIGVPIYFPLLSHADGTTAPVPPWKYASFTSSLLSFRGFIYFRDGLFLSVYFFLRPEGRRNLSPGGFASSVGPFLAAVLLPVRFLGVAVVSSLLCPTPLSNRGPPVGPSRLFWLCQLGRVI